MKQILINASVLCFIANPKDEEYHVTRDGQCFSSWHNANEHSKYLGNKDEDRHLEVIKRSDVQDQIDAVQPKEDAADELSKEQQIDACTKVEEVEALIKKNSAKALKEYAAAKIEALNKAAKA